MPKNILNWTPEDFEKGSWAHEMHALAKNTQNALPNPTVFKQLNKKHGLHFPRTIPSDLVGAVGEFLDPELLAEFKNAAEKVATGFKTAGKFLKDAPNNQEMSSFVERAIRSNWDLIETVDLPLLRGFGWQVNLTKSTTSALIELVGCLPRPALFAFYRTIEMLPAIGHPDIKGAQADFSTLQSSGSSNTTNWSNLDLSALDWENITKFSIAARSIGLRARMRELAFGAVAGAVPRQITVGGELEIGATFPIASNPLYSAFKFQSVFNGLIGSLMQWYLQGIEVATQLKLHRQANETHELLQSIDEKLNRL